jgi:hypothetical protein
MATLGLTAAEREERNRYMMYSYLDGATVKEIAVRFSLTELTVEKALWRQGVMEMCGVKVGQQNDNYTPNFSAWRAAQAMCRRWKRLGLGAKQGIPVHTVGRYSYDYENGHFGDVEYVVEPNNTLIIERLERMFQKYCECIHRRVRVARMRPYVTPKKIGGKPMLLEPPGAIKCRQLAARRWLEYYAEKTRGGNPQEAGAAQRALAVIVLTHKTSDYLADHDPQALKQAQQALDGNSWEDWYNEADRNFIAD